MRMKHCKGLRCNHLARVGTSVRTATPCFSVHSPGRSFRDREHSADIEAWAVAVAGAVHWHSSGTVGGRSTEALLAFRTIDAAVAAGRMRPASYSQADAVKTLDHKRI